MHASPVIRMAFRIPDFQHEQLRRWFVEMLKIEPPTLPAGEDSTASAVYLAHVLSLSARLLRAGKLAPPGPARVLACEPESGQTGRVRAEFVIPLPARIPRACLDRALRGALEACALMAARPCGAAAFESVCAILEPCIASLDAMLPGGLSTVPVLEAAQAQGVPVLHLVDGVYQLGWGSRAVRVERSSAGLDAAYAAHLVQNKALAAQVLAAGGCPVADHGAASNREAAVEVASRLGWPVVVKPLDGDRGEGVTVGVTSREALHDAFDRAIASSRARCALVERQMSTICHRLFVTSGRLLYALRRSPRAVIGDGRSTVAALIEQADRREQSLRPWKRALPSATDALAQRSIEQSGYSLDAVPPAGVRVPLRPIQSTGWGGTFEDVTDRVHPDNADLACRAARLFDLEVAGVDLLCEDIAEPWHESGAVVSEVNFAPSLGVVEQTLAYLPEYLSRLLGGDGRIPVEAIVGRDAAWPKALVRQRALVASGLRCHLTDAARTLGPDGREARLAAKGLAARVEALLLDREVDALIVLAGTKEALRGLPVEHFDSVASA